MTTPNTSRTYIKRASLKEIQHTIRLVEKHPLVTAILHATDSMALLLNPQHQIVAANRSSFRRLGVDPNSFMLGSRPGEMLNCLGSKLGPDGCTTGPACRLCGILRAITQTHKDEKGQDTEGQFLIERDGLEQALDLSIHTMPLELDGNRYTFVALRDISDTKRRQVLERVFLHDLRNTLTSLFGWTSILKSAPSDVSQEAFENIISVTKRLNREIRYQQDLLDAESGTFEPNFSRVSADDVLKEADALLKPNPLMKSRTIHLINPPQKITLFTDLHLLVRVLLNMLTNAIEATEKNGVIEFGCQAEENSCTFFVRNPGVMKNEVALQVFKRSISTKAKQGRGLGTYSMKLFGERYLKGKVWFTSNLQEGVTFRISLPLEPDRKS